MLDKLTNLWTAFSARFQHRSPSVDLLRARPLAEVEALSDRSFAAGKHLGLFGLTTELRQAMAGWRPSELQEIIFRAGSVLRKRPACAEATFATPELCELLSAQGMSLRSIIVAADEVATAAQDGALSLGESTTEDCQRLVDRAHALIADESADQQQRADTLTGFGHVFRLDKEHEQRDRAAKLQEALKLHPLNHQVQTTTDKAQALRLLESFLGAVQKEVPPPLDQVGQDGKGGKTAGHGKHQPAPPAPAK